jgi:signal transduction histidine kinase
MNRLLTCTFSVVNLSLLLPLHALATPSPLLDVPARPALTPPATQAGAGSLRLGQSGPSVALVEPRTQQSAQASQRLATPAVAEAAAPDAQLTPVRFAAPRKQALATAYARQHMALQQAQAHLRTAEHDRQQAWLVASGLGAALFLALGLGWWASRQQRRRADRAAQLRTRLATDLHQEVGTLLARVSQQAELLHEQQPEPSPALARLLGTSRAATHSVRDMAWSIDAQADTVGALLERMRDYLEQLATPAGLLTELHADGLYGSLRLPPELRQHLYFIFKEAVTNAVRHAVRPTRIVVTLTHYAVANALMLEVEDDGGPGPAPARTGTGLRTMHERAQALRGQLEVGAQPKGGFRVWLQVPF